MRIDLGNWTFPSENNCDAILETDGDSVIHLWLRWESPPPLTRRDLLHYRNVVLPEIIQMVGKPETLLEASRPCDMN
jgi:hypothetical protein